MIFALEEWPEGVETEGGLRVTYDLDRNEAHFGKAQIVGPAVVWRLDERPLVTQCHKESKAAVSVGVEFDPRIQWFARCDRVDFPPGSLAYRHVHPGPGIRRLVFGELTIDRGGGMRAYREGESWFEGANDPVLATASGAGDTAFVRVLLLPAEWAGRRTIRYIDPADEERPKLQRATVLLEEPLEL